MGINLSLDLGDDQQTFLATRLIVVGFAGRNTEAVEEHIQELEAIGVPRPASVPAFFHIDVSWLSQQKTLPITSDTVSGEAEPVLLFRNNNLQDALVVVGSDMTDRALERESFERSKSVPKPVGKHAWRYADIANQWDKLALSSWVKPDLENQKPYQSGTLSSLLTPETVLEKLDPAYRSDMVGTVMFMGTIPLNQDFAYIPHFHAQLKRGDGQTLSCVYEQVKT